MCQGKTGRGMGKAAVGSVKEKCVKSWLQSGIFWDAVFCAERLGQE